mgnify:CR=1 FL=1
MKIKTFMAMLAAALLCVTSFSACSDDDDDDSKRYTYEFSAELTDPGDMTDDEIAVNETALFVLEEAQNKELAKTAITSEQAKLLFDTIVENFKEGMENTPNTLTKPVKVTFSMTNKSLGKVEFSEVVTIQPGK